MALNPAFAGHTYPPTPAYVVGREKIREFATAIGAMESIHHDPEAATASGYLDVVAPATFAIALTASAVEQLIADPELGLDFTRVVHGEQKFAYQRPIQAGDQLVCECTITDITERAGNGFLTTSTAIRTEAGELVVTATQKLVVRA
jgi:acyl dehydratase